MDRLGIVVRSPLREPLREAALQRPFSAGMPI